MYGLGTDSFLNALAKKKHRRGIPVIITPDFVGDEKDMRESVQVLHSKKTMRSVRDKDVK